MAFSAGDPIQWSPGKALGMITPLGTNETFTGYWVHTNGNGPVNAYPSVATGYYATPTYPSVAHPRLIANAKEPSFHSNNNTVSLELINELELKAYPRNHGREKWIALTSGSAVASIVYPGTTIYDDNTPAGIYTSGSIPEKYTFTIVAGRTYWANKPVSFMAHGLQDSFAPVTLAGNVFVHYSNRDGGTTLRFYSFDDTEIEIFENSPTGILGSPTHVLSTLAGAVNWYFVDASDPTKTYIRSNGRIVVTAMEENGDRMVVPPASEIVYTQRAGTSTNIWGGTPSTGTHVSTGSPVLNATAIDDGAGNDALMGLGIEHISNTYAYAGIGLSDFMIVSPFNQTVTTYYWDTGTSTWQIAFTDTLSGNILSPGSKGRSGPNGSGSYDGSGGAPFFSFEAGEPELWKWEAPYPFYLSVNDEDDDEETLLGWCEPRASYSSGPWTILKEAVDSVDRNPQWLLIS